MVATGGGGGGPISTTAIIVHDLHPSVTSSGSWGFGGTFSNASGQEFLATVRAVCVPASDRTLRAGSPARVLPSSHRHAEASGRDP